MMVEGLQSEKGMKGKLDRKGSRNESLWGGSSVDKPGNTGQGEGASASRAPCAYPSSYTYKVASVHHQESQDLLLPLQIKL